MSDGIPPLPVAPRIGREGRQRGVLGVAENAERVRGLAIGPRGVPEDTREAECDRPALRVGRNS